MNREQLIAWARGEADRILGLSMGTSTTQAYRGRHQTASAVEFLTRQAPGSAWATEAAHIQAGANWLGDLYRNMAGLLRAWANYVEAGLANALPIEVEARITAASDLMEQVDRLLEDRDVHVAAPVVLAGAALEEMLRSLMPSGTVIEGKPGLDKYGAALKKAGVITTAEAKDITAWAGQRNDAAHGHFEALSRDRARLMADGINLFMRRHDARL